MNLMSVVSQPSVSAHVSASVSLPKEIHEGHCLNEDSLEGRHLHEERRREIHAIDTSVLRLLFGHCLDGRGGDSCEESSAVDNLRSFDDLPMRCLLAMLD